MKVLCFCLLFKIIICCSASAQVRKITGLVSFNNERQSGVNIKDISIHTQAISNDIGEFTITAKTGDTLIARKEEFVKDTALVDDALYFVINLKKNPIMLKEVIVNAGALSPAKKLEDSKKDYHEIYRVGDKSNIIGPDNVDKIWSALSREGNNARNLQHTFNTDYQNSIIDHRFTKNLVMGITGYKAKRLDDFMIKYRPTYEMVKDANDYELGEYIKKEFCLAKKSGI
ncbi:hypothetical protein KXD93_15285 [Mucilaginibacter sp. BJC16-A38]|uniref:hypothetical protein n=1 Tax=Mucilaginibacter phenanthrenivorans TaxID=1234842 RepID=UPI00215769FD|nr:hypothetical protein [Mucilaginibacter phenanthrenivorans]MCR8559019.1 hypothetical protein [Mucilaginibacter phenanthrenivorans]